MMFAAAIGSRGCSPTGAPCSPDRSRVRLTGSVQPNNKFGEEAHMKGEALFLNGVYHSVLEEILAVQAVLPEQIMFLQPYKSAAIARLRDDPPSVDDPMRLVISLTTDLPTVRYTAEIVGWDDKRRLPGTPRHRVLNRLICTLQPNEGGLYNLSTAEEGESVNLLHVRRLREVRTPFSVSRLTKTEGAPVSDQRATSGGWAYIQTAGLAEVLG
jgi:hypothetical protein